MNNAFTSACLASVLFVSVAQAGPAAQWQQRKPDFQAILVEYGRDGWCDWARFSVLTMMSYQAAKNEGLRRGWGSGQTNALRHALWQYQLTHAFGDHVARAIGDQQEQYSTDPKDSAIDQHNNLQARVLFRKYEQSGVPLDMAIRYIVRSIDRELGTFITRQSPSSCPSPRGAGRGKMSTPFAVFRAYDSLLCLPIQIKPNPNPSKPSPL